MQTFIFLMLVIVVVCVITTLVILSQNPKGGGLSSTFGGGGGGGGQMFGVQRTNEFLDKATWSLGGIIVFLCIVANVLMTNPNSIKKADIESVPVDLPQLPADNGGGDVAPADVVPGE